MLVSLVMLIPDNLTTLITYCTVVESFFTTLSCSAVLWLRYKKPDLPRPIKVQTWIPVTFVVVSTILMVVPILSEPVAVVAGALITFAGVPVYWAFVRAKPRVVRDLSTKFTHTCQKLFLSAVEEKDD
ncbi:cystine/glutamate transporter-like, partial [Ostrinia furnacalis]